MAAGRKIGVIQHGPGRDDACHGPLDKSLGGARIFRLFANGYGIALVHKLCDVGLCGMPRNAAHGHGVCRIAAAAGKGDLQFFSGNGGIIEEQLVKVAHTIKEQRIRVFFLDAHVLFEHGRHFDSRFRHRLGVGQRLAKGEGKAAFLWGRMPASKNAA